MRNSVANGVAYLPANATKTMEKMHLHRNGYICVRVCAPPNVISFCSMHFLLAYQNRAMRYKVVALFSISFSIFCSPFFNFIHSNSTYNLMYKFYCLHIKIRCSISVQSTHEFYGAASKWKRTRARART